MIDTKLDLLRNFLLKKKEKVIIDLIIKDYDKTNFYIALVFNYNIEKFKVLFVPLDVMEEKNIEEYLCYQFIFLSSVNYMLETINEAKEIYKEESFRQQGNKTMKAYYLEINTHIDGEDYKFITNQSLPEEWNFLFDTIVTLFEHVPNIVSELCNKILALFNNVKAYVKYDYSFDVDFSRNDLGVFTKEEVELGQKIYATDRIKYLEKVQDKYYAIVDDDIVILEYNLMKGILNVYSDNKKIGKECFYAVVLAIKDNLILKFMKLSITEESQKLNYLCYDINDKGFLVIHKNEKKVIPLKDLIEGKISSFKVSKELNKKLEMIVKNKYSLEEWEKVKDSLIIEEK